MLCRDDSIAMRLVTRLRGACIEFKKPKEFNSFLKGEHKEVSSHIGFWELMGSKRLGFISADECEGGETVEECQAFTRSLPSANKAQES